MVTKHKGMRKISGYYFLTQLIDAKRKGKKKKKKERNEKENHQIVPFTLVI